MTESFPTPPDVFPAQGDFMEAAGVEPAKRSPRRFVYFIQCGEYGPIKIGIATNLDKRLGELQVASPYELSVIGFIPSNDADDLETFLHCMFREHRIRGEWYEPAREILDYVAKSIREVLA